MRRALLVALALAVTRPAGAVFKGRALRPEEDLIRRSAVELVDAHGHYCSGTLIRPRIVLTAAHCVVQGPSSFRLPTEVRFLAGGAPGAMDNIRLLRRYVDNKTDGDLALVLLKGAAPAQAKEAAPFDGRPEHHAHVLLAGSGLTETGGFQGLRVLDMSLGFQDDGNFVVSDLEHAYGACPGDSGGGSFIDQGGLFLLGVNSNAGRSNTCENSGPSNLASVAKDRAWIDANVERLLSGRHGRVSDSDAETLDVVGYLRAREGTARVLDEKGARAIPKGSLEELFNRR